MLKRRPLVLCRFFSLQSSLLARLLSSRVHCRWCVCTTRRASAFCTSGEEAPEQFILSFMEYTAVYRATACEPPSFSRMSSGRPTMAGKEDVWCDDQKNSSVRMIVDGASRDHN